MFGEKIEIKLTSLRCVDCEFEFKLLMMPKDNLTDVVCKNCHKSGHVEVNYGKCK